MYHMIHRYMTISHQTNKEKISSKVAIVKYLSCTKSTILHVSLHITCHWQIREWGYTGEGNYLITACKRSLRRLCFHRCLSIHSGKGGCLPHCMLGYTPPWADIPHADTPLGRHPRADTPPLHGTCWDTVNKQAVFIPLECNLVT